MKFVIDVPKDFKGDDPFGPSVLRIPYFLSGSGGKAEYLVTNIVLEPYEEQEIKVRDDIIEALEILRDSMGEIEETFTGMIESIRRENEG